MGGGRVCIIKSYMSIKPSDPKDASKVAGKFALVITVEQTDSSGVTRAISDANMLASSGQKVGFEDAVVNVRLTPHIKQ